VPTEFPKSTAQVTSITGLSAARRRTASVFLPFTRYQVWFDTSMKLIPIDSVANPLVKGAAQGAPRKN
jgi:hypothetical protein